MNKLILILCLPALLLSLDSCKKDDDCDEQLGSATTKIVSLDSLNRVKFRVPGTLTIVPSDSFSAVINGPSKLVNKINTSVVSNLWDVHYGETECDEKTVINVQLLVPNITSAELSGTGTIYIRNFENHRSLAVSISGNGDIFIEDQKNISLVSCNITGNGSIVWRGEIDSVDQFTANLSGNGEVNALHLQCFNASVNISGNADVRTRVTNNLDVDISGNGHVYYYGSPWITKKITGNGSVQQLQ